MASALVSLKSKVRLSPGEQRLLQLLPTGGRRISTDELTKQYYSGKPEPFNSRLVVVGMVRNLQRKIGTIKTSPLYVHCSDRAGPYPMEVWRSNSRAV